MCARARQFLLAGWPAGRVLGIGQKRILPTKPKISRLITRRLIECRSFRALSARCLFSRSLPPSRRADSFSLSCFAVPSLCRAVSLPGSRPLRHQQRSPLGPTALLCERPSSATVFDPLSPPPPPPHRPPPHLIHIHAVVIVCRLPAGGHYYTSCARSRHREAATLLLSSLLSSVSPCPVLRLPRSYRFLGIAPRRASR